MSIWRLLAGPAKAGFPEFFFEESLQQGFKYLGVFIGAPYLWKSPIAEVW